MSAVDRTSARSFWKYSNEYLKAAVLVQPRPHSRVEELRQRVSIPAYFLAGHAIELSLKSFLRKRGVTVEVLRSREYGHDLEALVSEAKRRKLGKVATLRTAERRAVALLNRTYKLKELEYLTGGGKALPAYGVLLDLAQRLVSSLKDFIMQPEPNKRLEPTRSKQRAAQA